MADDSYRRPTFTTLFSTAEAGLPPSAKNVTTNTAASITFFMEPPNVTRLDDPQNSCYYTAIES